MTMISIIVPVFNEESVINKFYRVLSSHLLAGFDYEIIFVDDGSDDKSLRIIQQLTEHDSRIRYISLAKNYGQEKAIFTGIRKASGDACIVIDCDLQDPPSLIPKMIRVWRSGAKIVLPRRVNRLDSVRKKATAHIFYQFFNLISHHKLDPQIGEFYLLDKEARLELLRLVKNPLFLRGTVQMLRFEKKIVPYHRDRRDSGKTGYTYKKMLKLAYQAFYFIKKQGIYTDINIDESNVNLNKNIAIVGGGVLGLSVAYFLSKQGIKVEIFEKEKTTGGLLQSIHLDSNTRIEKFYHHFFRNDYELLNLLKDLHISKKIIWRETKTAILYDNLLTPFDGVVDFFRLSFLDLMTKFRMIVGMILYTYAPEIFLKQKTAKQAVQFFAGKKAWHNFWNFLFVSKFGQEGHKISAMWLKYRLATRGRSRDKNKESLGYLRGGFGMLVDILEKEIERRGGIIHKNKPVNKILTNRNKCVIAGKKFDFCVSTIPLSELQKISRIKLPKIQHLGFVGVVASLKKTFSSYYWINVFDHKAPFGVIVEQNNLSAVSKNNILYLGKYISANSIFFKKNEEQIQKIAEKWLLKIEPTVQIQKLITFKEKYAQPVILADYEHLPRKIDGLYLSSMAHIYPQDRGINYAIKEAQEITTRIMKDLNRL